MNQKVKRQRVVVFTHTKKVDIGSFIQVRIRIRSQTSGSRSAKLDTSTNKLVSSIRILKTLDTLLFPLGLVYIEPRVTPGSSN
jgi:hypothetical protein